MKNFYSEPRVCPAFRLEYDGQADLYTGWIGGKRALLVKIIIYIIEQWENKKNYEKTTIIVRHLR